MEVVRKVRVAEAHDDLPAIKRLMSKPLIVVDARVENDEWG